MDELFIEGDDDQLIEINRLIALLEVNPDVLTLIKLFSEDQSPLQVHHHNSSSMDD